LISDPLRSQPRETVFLAQQFCELKEKRQSLFGVIGAPHYGVEAGHFCWIELAKTSGAVAEQIDYGPTRQDYQKTREAEQKKYAGVS